MAFQVRVTALAQKKIDEFADYLRDYSEDLVARQLDWLDHILSATLRDSPLTWSYFVFTGAPYRAYLFRVGRRTQYWIIYTVDEDARTVDVLQILERDARSGSAGFVMT